MAWLSPRDTLEENEIERGLQSLIRDGLASQAMAVLTGGVFLVAIACNLGASNLVIGLLAAIPPLTQILQIPSIFLVNKVRNRRAVSLLASLISRVPWLVVALAPFIFPPQAGLAVIVIALIVHTSAAAVSGCAWNSWMRDFVPENKMGGFFSKRMQLATGLGLMLSLVGGVGIDWWKKAYPDQEILAYSFLFGAGFIAGMIGVYYISRIPEPRMKPADNTGFLKMLWEPFRNINFRKLLMFSGSWSFAVNLAGPFFTVYMLRRLDTGMSLVVALSIVSQVSNFLFLRIWGGFTDKYSNKSVLAVSGPLFLICILGWTFTTMPEKHIFTLPLLVILHVVMGIAAAGIALASGNIALKLAPRGEATAYLAANTLVSSVAAAISPILGGKFADFFAQRSLSLVFKWQSPAKEVVFDTLSFSHWDFFFALAFFAGLYAMHRLSFIEEEGEVEESVVREELLSVIVSPIRSLSTAAGLFQVISFPVSAVNRMRKRFL